MTNRRLLTACLFCFTSLSAADLKVFVPGNDIGAGTLRKAATAGKIKCVAAVSKQADANAELSVKTQKILVPLGLGEETSYSATLTAASGEQLWTETSTSGLARIAKSLSQFACGRKGD